MYWKHIHLPHFEQIRKSALEYVPDIVKPSIPFWTTLNCADALASIAYLREDVAEVLNTEPWLIALLVLNQRQTGRHTDHTAGQRGQVGRLNLVVLVWITTYTIITYSNQGDELICR